MPLPLTAPCFSKIQIGFTFLVPAHLGSPGQRVCVRARVCAVVAITRLQTQQAAAALDTLQRKKQMISWSGCNKSTLLTGQQQLQVAFSVR